MSERRAAVTELGAGEPVVELLQPRLLAVLDQAPPFHALSRRHRRRVAKLAEFRRYEDGATIVRVGDRGVAFYIVLDGEARMVPAQGRERSLTSGDHFGELSLFDGVPRSATVSAAGPLTAARIARVDFARLLREEPTLTVGLLPGLVLIVRDLLRADAQRIPDLGRLDPSHSRGREGETAAGAAVAVLEERTALGWRQLLRHVALFEELPERHLQRIAQLVAIERYGDGATVMLAGAKGDSFQVILDGRARVRTPGGHTRTLEANECFGELALLDGAPRSATVVAVGALTTAQIRRADFQRILRDEPAMAVGLLKNLVRTVRDMQLATSSLLAEGAVFE